MTARPSRPACSAFRRNLARAFYLSSWRYALPLLDRLTAQELGFERDLVSGKAHRRASRRHIHAFHFKQYLAGANHCYPLFRRTFTLTHTGFSRLLGDRLIREQTNPDFAAALDETSHRDTGRFNLAGRDPAALHRL